MPTVAPMLRKSWEDAVATPRSSCSNAFCTASVKTGKVAPMPSPVAIMRKTSDRDEVVADIRDMAKSATVASASPTTATLL